MYRDDSSCNKEWVPLPCVSSSNTYSLDIIFINSKVTFYNLKDFVEKSYITIYKSSIQ